MKFKYGSYKGPTDVGRFESSFLDHHLTTEGLNEDTTLKQVADLIREKLKMEDGEIELSMVFRYKKKVDL